MMFLCNKKNIYFSFLLLFISYILLSCTRVKNITEIETYVATDSNIDTEDNNNIIEFLETEVEDITTEDSKYKQNEFHPYETDYFGDLVDKYPISRVKVDENDEKRRNKICITFDGSYKGKNTDKLLDLLDKYDAKCTFFMTSNYIRKNPEQIKDIINRGHEIGNHTENHYDLNQYSDVVLTREVMNCHNEMKQLTDVNMCLFRFPYGYYNDRTVSILKLLGYYPIQWTVDSADWKSTNKDAIVRRIKYNDQKITEGSILLFHLGVDNTYDALPEVFEYLDTKNLKSVKVSDMIYEHNFVIRNGFQQFDMK